MREPPLILGALVLASLLCLTDKALAQGCICVRQTSPGLLGQGYLPAGDWQATVGYRWLHSDRHFTGDHEDANRQQEGSEVINDVHSIDLSVTYAITKQINATLTLPFQVADRSQVVRSNDVNRTILERFHTGANGLGDVRLLGSVWLLDPQKHAKRNISLGLGVKFPTGEKDARDTFRTFDAATGQIVNTNQTVDQSIQPGDGGWGAIIDLLAFTEIVPRVTAFVAGTYVMTPEETSGVPTYRSRPQEAVMSIADQYLGRAGVNFDVLPSQGLSLSLAGRIEGVPVRDLVGGSEGFRRPGFAISVEPGITYRKGRFAISVLTPVAVYRNRERSVPDLEASTPANLRHGDAAFADFLVQAAASIRF